MKFRVNIFSGEPGIKLDWIRGLTEAVPVFHTSLSGGHEIGMASEYEIEGEDLWAVVDVPVYCPAFSRAAAVLDGAQMKAVVITNLPREVFIDLMAQFGAATAPKTTGRALA